MILLLAVISFTQNCFGQETKEPYPGVKVKVLVENEHVKVFEVTVAPGATADWHSHPQHTIYAATDATMKLEEKDKDPVTVELKAGQAIWAGPVTHKLTNSGKKSFTAIFTEIKEK